MHVAVFGGFCSARGHALFHTVPSLVPYSTKPGSIQHQAWFHAVPSLVWLGTIETPISQDDKSRLYAAIAKTTRDMTYVSRYVSKHSVSLGLVRSRVRAL